MKILFQNRRKDAWQGGDYFQMEKTAEALRKLGLEVDISEEMVVSPTVIEQYDIVHLWNFSMIWTKYQLWVARKHKKPVVCSMIYHEFDTFVSFPHQQIMLDELSAQIYLTESEKERVKRRLKPTGKEFVIPNGIDEMWFKRVNVSKREMVLTAGRIEPNKGQLAVARACQMLGYQYICIGEIIDEVFAQELRDANVVLVDKQPPEELVKWYAKAKVFALVSKAEIFPLTVMEAMAQNCQIVLTKTSEWKPDVIYAEFNDENSIQKALMEALEGDHEYSNYIKEFTWDKVAEQIKNIYDRI